MDKAREYWKEYIKDYLSCFSDDYEEEYTDNELEEVITELFDSDKVWSVVESEISRLLRRVKE